MRGSALLILVSLLLLFGCVGQGTSQEQAEEQPSPSLPPTLAGLVPPNSTLLVSTSSSNSVEIGAMGNISYNLGKELAVNYEYLTSTPYEDLLSDYKKDLDGWELSSIKVRKKDSSPIAVALTLGLSALRDYESVSFLYRKPNCSYQFCPRLGITVVAGENPRVSISCVSYKLNESEFTTFVEEENRARQEALELGNEGVGPLVDAQAIIAANEGACR